ILNKQLVEQVAHPYPDSGIVLGQGWNVFLNRKVPTYALRAVCNPFARYGRMLRIYRLIYHVFLESLSGSAGGSYDPFSCIGSYMRYKTCSSYDASVVMNVVVDTGGELL
ncbi:hypothetical protein ACOZB2_33035, partial [Pantoea endophytica]